MEMEAERRIFLVEGPAFFRVVRFDGKAGKLWEKANARMIDIFATGRTLSKEPGEER